MALDSEALARSLTDSAAQARRVLRGKSFESVVMYILNGFLRSGGIFVVPGKKRALSEVIEDSANVDQLVSYTRLPVKRRCSQTQLEDYPDSDLFALIQPHHPSNAWRLLAIINCKVSFHARETEAAFWGMSVRSSSYVKYVCVTEDRNTYQAKGARSELGPSCQQSTKIRRLLESYTDRLYICKHYSGVGDGQLGEDIERKLHTMDRDRWRAETGPCFDNRDGPRHTEYCHLVRPIDELIDDLTRWKAEVPSAE